MKYWDNMGGDGRDYKDKKIKSRISNFKTRVHGIIKLLLITLAISRSL